MIEKILLAHGGGGRLTADLIERLIVPRFANSALAALMDSAVLDTLAGKLCFTTDSFVVKPLFFAGGDIGKLAVCGTVNDLAVCGAVPLAMTVSLIIEEGFEIAMLEKILDSIAATAQTAGVVVVAGDTKVVEAGAADGLFINTAGIGFQKTGTALGFDRIAAGDAVILTGTLGEHSMALMAQREGLAFASDIQSDCAPLNDLASGLLDQFGEAIKFMRDPTRGGLAATANEIVKKTGLSMLLNEADIPIDPRTQAAANMLGLDVLEAANEGKIVIVSAPAVARQIVAHCRRHPLAKHAAIIGQIVGSDVPTVELLTCIGGRRIVPMPYGRQLPRIC